MTTPVAAPIDYAMTMINQANENLGAITAGRMDTTTALAAVQAQGALAIASALLAVANAIGKAADHA